MEGLSGIPEEKDSRNDKNLTDDQLNDTTEGLLDTEKFTAVLDKLTQFGL